MKNTRRSLITSTVCLLLCVSMFVGSTFAWFTDSVTSGVNQIVAGNLDVELYHQDGDMNGYQVVTGDTTLFNDVDLWEPGAVAFENFKVENKGSLALKYNFNFSTLQAGVNYNFLVEKDATTPTESSLLDVLYVLVGEKFVGTDRPSLSKSTTGAVTLKTFIAHSEQFGNLLAGESDEFSLTVFWPNDNEGGFDNLYNVNNGRTVTKLNGADETALKITFPVTLVATQYMHEEDSFGIDYDKLADGVNKYESGFTTVSTGTLPVTDSSSKDNAVVSELTVIENSVIAVNYPEGVKLNKTGVIGTDNKTEVTQKLENVPQRNDSSIVVDDGASHLSYELTLPVASDNRVLVPVTIKNYGKNLMDIRVYHSGKVLATESTDDEYYSYDSTTGNLTLYVFHASPIDIVFKQMKALVTTDGTASSFGSLEEAVRNADVHSTIKLVDDVSINNVLTNGYTFSGGLKAINGLTIDGDGHKIVVPETMDRITDVLFNSTLKNCSVVFEGKEENSISLYSINSVYDGVDVYGNSGYTGNCGAYAIYVQNNITLKNCTSYMNVNGTSYNAVFVGYPNTNGTLTFDNCVNKGSFVSAGAGMFIGNPTYNNYTVNITNCRNEGIIRQTTVNNTTYLHNPIFGITTDSAGNKTFNIDGTTYTDYFKQYKYLNIPFTHFGSGFSCGPNDTTFAIAKDADGYITITPASDSSVAYYVVYIGNQARLIAGGSQQICFAEKVVPNAGGTLTVNLNGNYKFVDNTWVKNNSDATRSEQKVTGENGNEITYSIYTLNGVSYYALDSDEVDYSDHQPAENYRLVAYAFNENGQLISSVGNFFK